jgi:hypothetical protein
MESPKVVTANGTDLSGTNSIPPSECKASSSLLTASEALPISKQQIVVVEDSSNAPPTAAATNSLVTGPPSAWKQGQLPHSTSTNLGSSNKIDISSQALSDEKLGLTKLELDSKAVDFIPSVNAAELKHSAPSVVIIKDLETTPVVSAQTSAPVSEAVRASREQFPALVSNAPLHQSPRRKQTQRPEAASSVPQATTVASNSSVQSTLPPALSTSRETTPAAETKASKKPAATEDTTSSSAFPVPQPPKERRDQDKSHGREREKSSVSSQGRAEREKSVSSPSSSSQHHGRDREKSSLDKDKVNAASQSGPKDRDKSASRGKDREKPSVKEATAAPSPAVLPTVTSAASQPQAEQPTPGRPTAAVEGTKQNNGEMTAADATEGECIFTEECACRRIWKQHIVYSSLVCIS